MKVRKHFGQGKKKKTREQRRWDEERKKKREFIVWRRSFHIKRAARRHAKLHQTSRRHLPPWRKPTLSRPFVELPQMLSLSLSLSWTTCCWWRREHPSWKKKIFRAEKKKKKSLWHLTPPDVQVSHNRHTSRVSSSIFMKFEFADSADRPSINFDHLDELSKVLARLIDSSS